MVMPRLYSSCSVDPSDQIHMIQLCIRHTTKVLHECNTNFGKTFQTSELTIQLAGGATATHVPYLPRNFAYKKPRWFTKGNYVPATGTVTSIKRSTIMYCLSN